MRILLVEDDLMVGEAARKGLRQDGFAVDWVQDGVAAELALRQEDYALVLLDLGLPQKNGLAVLQQLRAAGNKVPVLIVTARDAVADRVAGLDAGADDYLIKPYDLEELSARMRALLRRQAGRADSLIQVRDVSLNPATREVLLQGQPVALSAREFTLLQAFLDR
ncbi:response regulator, partial [Herbaspirillum sp. 3C11]|uniref:response regulator n=3 Tax=Herbaspirillum TaxID=963 RepID=UPI00107316D2